MFKDIVEGIKADIKHDWDLATGKDIRPYGEYNVFDRKKLGIVATIKSLKMSYDKMGREQEEAREAEKNCDVFEKNFTQRAISTYRTHKRPIVVALTVGALGVSAFFHMNTMKDNFQNLLDETGITDAIEAVEQVKGMSQGDDITEMKNPVVEITEDGKVDIKDKSQIDEQEEFKNELREDTVQEEELTQEQLEERAEEKVKENAVTEKEINVER